MEIASRSCCGSTSTPARKGQRATAARRGVAVAATERTRILRRRGRLVLRGMPWVVAGIGVLGGRVARAQSSVELRYLYYGESEGRTKVCLLYTSPSPRDGLL